MNAVPQVSTDVPRALGSLAERVIAARSQRRRLKRVFDRSPLPMVQVDGQRRYIQANTMARLAFRLSLAELRQRRIDDLTPPRLFGVLEDAWARLTESGCMAGEYEVASPDGSLLPITYYALADALPGRYLIAFAPSDWPERELQVDYESIDAAFVPRLTPRELEVLELAADGRNGPMIASELMVSPATVQTHFENIYAKLGVGERAAAVAKAMRLGLIF